MKPNLNNSFNNDFEFYKNIKNEEPIIKRVKQPVSLTDEDYNNNSFNSDDYDYYVNMKNGASLTKTTKPFTITKNGEYNVNIVNSVLVDVTGGGGGSANNDVVFYDYDGTVVDSYSADEFANLSELPTNPTHEGLTAQGWNWSLSDAKDYVAKYSALNIGQTYITSDGKTRLYISLLEGRTSPILQLYLNDNSELDIDWGDESTHSTFTTTSAGYKSERHEYFTSGDYVIAITIVSGGFVLLSSSTSVSSILWNGNDSSSSPDRAYNNAIKNIEIGDGVTSIEGYAFKGCSSLSSITIPDSVTSIGGSAFYQCQYMSYIKFESTTPPTVANSSAWTGVSTSTLILVPVGSYDAYKTGTNYPKPSTYTYLAYGTYAEGESLPTTTGSYNLTWYASLDDVSGLTNPITVGNGNEVYAIAST